LDHIHPLYENSPSCARRIGNIPKYNLQYLRCYLGLEVDATPHDTLGDILVLEPVFNRIYAKFANGLKNPVFEIIKISGNPILLPRMPFGKHKGMLFYKVPMDYLECLLATRSDEDIGVYRKGVFGAVAWMI
jgi:exodeoxyribonuclease X